MSCVENQQATTHRTFDSRQLTNLEIQKNLICNSDFFIKTTKFPSFEKFNWKIEVQI